MEWLSLIIAITMIGIIGGLIYGGIEIVYDNTSHRSMVLVGGVSFVIGGILSELMFGYPVMVRCLVISTVITTLEYFAGRYWNADFSIWDYRGKRLNLHGQICLSFYLIWFIVISPIIMWLFHELLYVDYMELFGHYIRFWTLQ